MPKDSLNKRKFDDKEKNDSNILFTFKKKSQLKRCEIIEF